MYLNMALNAYYKPYLMYLPYLIYFTKLYSFSIEQGCRFDFAIGGDITADNRHLFDQNNF